MVEKKNNLNYIFLNFISYSKFSFKNSDKKIIFKKFNKIILILWLLKKYKDTVSVEFKWLKKFSSYYVLLKSPKNYKKGKLILKYSYYKYLVILKKKSYQKNLNSSLEYFKYFIFLFKNLDSTYFLNNKITFNIKFLAIDFI